MKWRTFVNDYLRFSKKDRWAALCVPVIGAGVYLMPRFFSHPAAADIHEDTALLRALDTIQKENKAFEPRDENASISFHAPSTDVQFTEGELFAFDPNTLPTEGWQRLGLNNRTIRTLNNYRNKGGRFYRKEDLKKIWGLPQAFYDRVAPYIQLNEERSAYTPHPAGSNLSTYTPAKGKRSVSVVQVNEADTAALIALPGIGPTLARRIINFRDKLGGFYTTEQIGETYGLPDSTFQMLKPYLQVNTSAVKKLNLNTATKDELRTHPYIKWQLANAIVEYRSRHGAFKNLEELKNIMLIDEATFQKIAPYFSL